MANKSPYKTTFEVSEVISPIFTGGAISFESGARILATTLGEDAVLTDLKSGKHLTKVEGDGELISTLTLTPSGSHLIICSRSLSMRIYALQKNTSTDAIEPRLLRTVKPHSTPVVVLAVDRTSTLLATGGTDGSIKVWDIAGGYVTHTFRGPSVLVSALHFFEVAAGSQKAESQAVDKHKRRKSKGDRNDDDGDEQSAAPNFRLASGSQDGKVRVWDLHKRSVVANLDSHVSDVQGIEFSPKQNTLVTAGRDKTIRWWDAKSWKPRRVTPCMELVETVGFLEDGRLTYSAGSNGCFRLWDTDTGREVTKDQAPKAETETFVGGAHAPGSSVVICVQVDHTLAFFQAPDDALTKATVDAPPPFRRITGTHDDIIDLCYLLPDQTAMALATNSEDIRIVSVTESSGAGAGSFGQDIGVLKGHDDIIIALDVDWSGHWVATGAKDNTARLWRVDPANNSYICWATFKGHAESVSAVSLPHTRPVEGSKAFASPLDHPPQYLITGSSDQTIKRWDVPREVQQGSKKGSSRALYTRKAHDKDINAIDASQGAQLFASASQDKTVKIWSVEEGEVQGILRGHRRGVWSVSFAPPNTPIIQGEQGPVAGKGAIITGSGDKTVKLWNLNDYTCLRTFEGHSHSVLKVSWLGIPPQEELSKKPILFASAAGDGLVKIWNLNLGETECTLDNHEDRVWALAVHPKTNMVVSGSADSTVTFWKDTSKETQAASTEAALQLVEKEQELQNHIHAGSYREAITLALQLNHPGRLLALFTTVVNTKTPDAGSLTGLAAVDQVLASLSDEQIFLLLLRLRDWNTNARTAPIAQRILWALVRSYPASKFSALSVKGAKGQKSLKEVLNALKVYTERHYKRIEELVDESFLVEYTLKEMDSLAPSVGLIDGVDGDVAMT
ncbi:WD repeat domain-containing protein [Microdochium bolleyi]|uniref:WD repeat domain-containing protein n=1 Tax=Microdochium bolleyi TaxID=196109 RepID=A0A136J658_9PEZI|nr:WD repeat domain-containing protein [Microdochium bolleyi]